MSGRAAELAATVRSDPIAVLRQFMEDRLRDVPVDENRLEWEALAAVEQLVEAARDIESKVVDGPDWNVGEVFNAAGRLRAALSPFADPEVAP
jgi:predicted RecB family nuclease